MKVERLLAKLINISDRLSKGKPKIQIGEKQYEINDSMSNVIKFEELASASTSESMLKAIELSLGKAAVKEIGVQDWSISNFKILITAILAAMQDMEYEEAEKRFQAAGQPK